MSGSVPCPSCGLPVPAGRLACPACGNLVASLTQAAPAPVPGPADPAAASPSEPLGAQAGAPYPTASAWPDRQAAEAAPAEAVGTVVPGLESEPVSTAGPDPQPEPEVEVEPEVEQRHQPEPEPEPEPKPEPASEPEPDTDLAAATLAGDGVASGGIVPGSYLPPSTVHRPSVPAADPPSWPSGPPPLPAEWAPRPASPAAEPAPWAPTPAAVGPTPMATAAPVAAAPAAIERAADAGARQLVPGKASILSDLPFDAPDEIEGWLVTLGAGVSALAFFLPWRDSLGEGIDGYFGSWGLGIAANLPMFVLVVVVLALALLPNRVAAWVRTGVLGMVIGGILFGLVWLYLEGGASQLGALLGAVGAVLMIGGGTIAVAPGRAKRRDPDA